MILGANNAHQQSQDCRGEVKGLIDKTSPCLMSVLLYFTNNDWEVNMDTWMFQFHNPLEKKKISSFCVTIWHCNG